MKKDFYLVAPNIRSAHNVGAFFRTADAFGVTKIFLVGYTAAPPKPQIDKVSLGAEQWVPWEKRVYLKPVIKRLKKRGVKIIALEQNKKSINISDLNQEKINLAGEAGVALIVGNELKGVRTDILRLCDAIVHIPMQGMKESLNVSVAAGIAMQRISEQLN